MAKDWEKLAEEFKDNAVGFVAEVDCTAEGKSLCDANGIRGFPTLKYGDPSSLEDYQGQRTYDALAAFAKDNLKPVCSPANLDLCEADKKKQIEEYMKLTAEDLASKIEAEEKKLTDAEEHFSEEVKKLQETYQKLSEEKDKKLAEVKDSGLGLLKAVKSFKTKGEKKDKDEL
jgi:Thioredoxin